MKFFKYLLVSLMLLLPAFASAAPGGSETISPPGLNAWEMHVMGNGPIIKSILESVKLVIAPDHGGGGFLTLMLFMSITGFCILAIQAGFNPGANLFKMFGYLFVVLIVSLTATRMKANLVVVDPISNTADMVVGVPAIVAIPAAVVSGIGHYLTETIQQNYSAVGQSASLSESGFDIFGKIQSDLDQFTIARPELQRSMAAFVTDCTVPALAQHRIATADLFNSNDLLKTLENAKSPVFLTRYFAEAPARTDGTPQTSLGLASDLVTCTEAYDKIKVDMDKHAQQLLKASSAEWTRSGVMVPFEQTLQTYVEHANIGRGENGGIYGRPNGIITQKALINTMGGDFRQAAISTGNNELLMGLQITQAEQSQKSGWVTSAAVFKNMMGYVYTTLQAFIFAIVPIVTIALLIPGLGKKIFVNYGQILVWLTLWEPMLSIVNYLVTLFRMEGVRNAVQQSGGFTMMNSWVLSEGANNMVIAASFLGTMVPILCWGLVTGAMAFNEFISQGVGSSFAMSAGANAATGVTSMNNTNMGNVSNNKFDNAHKSTVGNQSVMAHEVAGVMTTNDDRGGHQISANGANFSQQMSLAKSEAAAAGTGTNAAVTTSATDTTGMNSSKNMGSSDSSKVDQNLANHREQGQQSGTNGSKTTSTGESTSVGDSSKTSQSSKINDQVTAQVGLGANAGIPGSGGGGKNGAGGDKKDKIPDIVKAQGTSGLNQATTNASEMNASQDKSASHSQKADSGTQVGTTASSTAGNGTRETLTTGRTHSTDASNSTGVSDSSQVSKASTVGTSATTSHTTTESLGNTASFGQNLTGQDADALMSLSGPQSLGAAASAADEIYGAASGHAATAQGNIGAAHDALQGAGTNSGGFGLTNAAGTGADSAMLSGFQTEVTKSTGAVSSAFATQTGAASSFMSSNLAGSQSFLSDQMSFGAGPKGGAPFAVNDEFDHKKAAVTAGVGMNAVTSLLNSETTGPWARRGAAAGAAAAAPYVIPTAAVAGAAVAGWGVGRGITHAIGEERVGQALEPAFKKFDEYTNNYFHQ